MYVATAGRRPMTMSAAGRNEHERNADHERHDAPRQVREHHEKCREPREVSVVERALAGTRPRSCRSPSSPAASRCLGSEGELHYRPVGSPTSSARGLYRARRRRTRAGTGDVAREGTTTQKYSKSAQYEIAMFTQEQELVARSCSSLAASTPFVKASARCRQWPRAPRPCRQCWRWPRRLVLALVDDHAIRCSPCRARLEILRGDLFERIRRRVLVGLTIRAPSAGQRPRPRPAHCRRRPAARPSPDHASCRTTNPARYQTRCGAAMFAELCLLVRRRRSAAAAARLVVDVLERSRPTGRP